MGRFHAYSRAALILFLVLAALSYPNNAYAQERREASVFLDGLPVGFPISPFVLDDTTMVPLRALSEALGFTVKFVDFDSPITCVKGATSISITLGNADVTVIDYRGTWVSIMKKAPYLEGDDTVIPLRFFSETLGYQVIWDDAAYTANVHSPKGNLQVWGFYALGSQGYSSWNDLFGQDYPFPIVPGEDSPVSGMAGSFMGWFAVDTEAAVIRANNHASAFARPDGWEAVLLRMRTAGSKPVAMFYADNAGGHLSSLLADPVKRDRLAVNMATAVTADFSGAAVDFEGLGLTAEAKDADAANLNAFCESLKTYLHGNTLYMVVPPLNGAYQGYDHKRLGELSDALVLMAYGYEDLSHPSATAPWDRVDEAIRLTAKVTPKEKIILGIPAYGTVYVSNEGVTSIKARPAAKDVTAGSAVAAWNPASSSETTSWEEDGTTYQAFLESNESLQARAQLALRHGLKGIAIWRLGLLDRGWWDAVSEVVQPVK